MTLENFQLENNVAIVTGGSRGIGEEIAVAMAEAGADVVPTARSEDELKKTVERIKSTGAETLLSPCDVTDQEAVTQLFNKVERQIGPVDVLVNNAGVNPFFGNLTDLDLETWKHIFEVNVQGAFNCAQQFGQRLRSKDESGSLINIASVGGVMALPYQTPYTASKHAIIGMTKCLAIEWAPNIRVNALAPGYVKTEFTEDVRQNESISEDILSDIPQGRFAEPEEIATSAVYLASSAAAYVTGEVHLTDGGMSA
jgi:NAD(P)-dependent dehydrogenase (short-subunit alcohol dehydrogenase family)